MGEPMMGLYIVRKHLMKKLYHNQPHPTKAELKAQQMTISV